MFDAFGTEMFIGDEVIMYSTQEGSLLRVILKKYNPATNQVSVQRTVDAGRWSKNTFSTPMYKFKFFKPKE